jgi:NADPH-dependent 2,4-dienoyl-CoA reductase/sulfur reductase-like enzyme
MLHYVIVGMGAAGIAASEAIRRRDPQGEILLISEEAEGYYSRPGLAYVLTGEINEKQLFPFMEADFRRLNLHWLNAHVARLHPATAC